MGAIQRAAKEDANARIWWSNTNQHLLWGDLELKRSWYCMPQWEA